MRTILRFLFSALGLLVASYVLPGLHHDSFVDLLAVAVVLGVLNATLGPLLKLIAFIPVVFSFGCFSLVINGLVFWLAGALSHRLGLAFQVDGFWAGFFGALITSLVAGFVEVVLIGREPKEGPPAPHNLKIVN